MVDSGAVISARPRSWVHQMSTQKLAPTVNANLAGAGGSPIKHDGYKQVMLYTSNTVFPWIALPQ
eukprot:7747046-Lingulodinium_polyedra.AAC.1